MVEKGVRFRRAASARRENDRRKDMIEINHKNSVQAQPTSANLKPSWREMATKGAESTRGELTSWIHLPENAGFPPRSEARECFGLERGPALR